MEDKYCADAVTWLQWADIMYLGARTLFQCENPALWFPAAVLGHQALELYLKAALIRQGHRVVKADIWGHDLSQLFHKLIVRLPTLPSGLAEKLEVFTGYFNELRYPKELVNVEGLGEQEVRLLEDLVKILRPCAAS